MTDSISKNFEEAHEKVQSILADYICGGYLETLAKLLIYMDKSKAEETLAKISEPLRGQLQETYTKLQEGKENPKVISAALRVLKAENFFGQTVCDALTENLTYSEKNELLSCSDELFEKDPLIAISVEENIITFDFITDLDDRAVQRILREVENTTLTKALINSAKSIQDKIFRNMSKRAVEMLKEDMEFMGPVNQYDVDEARDEIRKIMLKLRESGDIVFPEYY